MQSVETLAAQIRRALADSVPDSIARETLRELIIDFGKALIRQTTTDALAAINEAFEQVRGEHGM